MPQETTSSNLRAQIDGLMASGHADMAAVQLRKFWRDESGPASAAFVVSRFEKLRQQLTLIPCRLAILRSFTLEPIVPLVRASAFAHGIDLMVKLGEFNAFSQELLDSSSWLYDFNADIVMLAARTADVAPDLWTSSTSLEAQAMTAIVSRVAGSYQQLVRAFRQHSSASLIVHNLEQPIDPALGVLDAQQPSGQTNAIRQINCEIRQIANSERGVYILDYDALVARQGRTRWHDERKWLTARMPIAADQLINLSSEWLKFLAPLTGRVAKVLVADLDNTLWGGIIGEDGMNGIKLGAEYPGAAYQALQRAMLDLTRKGILLAICSKNNPDDAMQALQKHPGMLLRPEHFACMRISWNNKVQGLREIAAELNIGTDALAFVDDNPFEREQVRSAMPEVTVVDLPEDPLLYARAVQECPAFERLNLSAEDQQRTAMYSEQRARTQAETSFQTKEDFYRFLQQEAEISPLSAETLARIAQLTQKTNQFNLTTRRYSEAQISEIAATPGCQVLSFRMRDRFGDHGLVGVAITRDSRDECEIDTLLLSCRVIGRSAETAFLSHIADAAAQRSKRTLVGRFLPTRKNAPAKDFFALHGFSLQKETSEESVWKLDLHQHPVNCPDWIKCTVTGG